MYLYKICKQTFITLNTQKWKHVSIQSVIIQPHKIELLIRATRWMRPENTMLSEKASHKLANVVPRDMKCEKQADVVKGWGWGWGWGMACSAFLVCPKPWVLCQLPNKGACANPKDGRRKTTDPNHPGQIN